MARHRCPIQGHDHEVIGIYSHRQRGTGPFVADTFECPSGYYRWFVLRGRQLSDDIRQKRPRFGWSALADTHQYTPEKEKTFVLIRTFHYDNQTGDDERFEDVPLAVMQAIMQESIDPTKDVPKGAMGVTFRVVFPD